MSCLAHGIHIRAGAGVGSYDFFVFNAVRDWQRPIRWGSMCFCFVLIRMVVDDGASARSLDHFFPSPVSFGDPLTKVQNKGEAVDDDVVQLDWKQTIIDNGMPIDMATFERLDRGPTAFVIASILTKESIKLEGSPGEHELFIKGEDVLLIFRVTPDCGPTIASMEAIFQKEVYRAEDGSLSVKCNELFPQL